jgi:cytochrome c oxidase cbb3-type subunit 4
VNWISGAATVLCLVFFIAVCFWAFSRGRKEANRESANLPFALPDETEELRARQGTDPRQPSRPNGKSDT